MRKDAGVDGCEFYNISDKEAEEIRDDFHNFAEIIFDKWMDEREKAKNEKKEEPKI